MASDISIEVTPTDLLHLPVGPVREALRAVDGEDLSVSSPVSAGVPEAGVSPGDDGSVLVVVEGHDGDFTKTSERALKRALADVPFSVDVEVVDGGYEPDDEEE